MIRNLINQTVLISSISVNAILCSLGGAAIKNFDPNRIEYINQDLVLENRDQETVSVVENKPNLNFQGVNTDTLYRIYMSSDGDKQLPDRGSEKVNDYKIGKGKKDSWYKHLIQGLSLDVTKYATDKIDFLRKYKAITFSYFYNYNFWNTWKRWTFEYGKNSPLTVDVKTFPLTGNNTDWLLFDETDSSHSNNERANLVVKQEWNGNILSYNFYLGVSYHWQAGSTVKHSSLASFKGDDYTFTRVPKRAGDNSVKVDSLTGIKSNFTINRSREEIDMVALDDEIKRKAIDLDGFGFRNTSILVQGYCGSLKVDNKVYIFSLLVRWIEEPNKDSNSLLNGVDLSRDMSTIYGNATLRIHYENSNGIKQDSTPLKIREEYLGMEMQGNFFLPFIYY